MDSDIFHVFRSLSQSSTVVSGNETFRTEKYRSNIKKMYQNSYSLRVTIKTGAPHVVQTSSPLENTVVTHSVIYVQSNSQISA